MGIALGKSVCLLIGSCLYGIREREHDKLTLVAMHSIYRMTGVDNDENKQGKHKVIPRAGSFDFDLAGLFTELTPVISTFIWRVFASLNDIVPFQ